MRQAQENGRCLCLLLVLCRRTNYLARKHKAGGCRSSTPGSDSAGEALTAVSLPGGRGLTFRYSVSSPAFPSCSRPGTAGLAGNGLMGFGSARILPSSPNHCLPWGRSRGKDNTFFSWDTLAGKLCQHTGLTYPPPFPTDLLRSLSPLETESSPMPPN